jgi:galactose mutarotase-like enzyme
MVCTSWVVDEVELLGQRGGLEKYMRSGSTFGIPLLYPWANRLDREVDSPLVRRDANGLLIHGMLAASPYWQVVGDEPLTARLAFDRPEYLEVFPYPHTLEVEVRRAEREQVITTRVIVSGDAVEPVPVAFGWHPYLQIPDVPRADWELTLPLQTRMELDDRMLPTGRTEPVDYPDPLRLGDRTFDDPYAGVADGTTFALSGGGRTVEVEFVRGYRYAQVYAPPGEDVVCFEPMTAPTNALATGHGLREVQPGGTFEAVFALRAIP